MPPPARLPNCQTEFEPSLGSPSVTRANSDGALRDEVGAVKTALQSLAGIEQRLGIADRIAKLEDRVERLETRT